MAETTGGHAAESYLPENVRALRERKGMSQATLAKAMKDKDWPWHQTTVHRVETGTQGIGFGETVDLAQILGVTTDRLTWAGPESSEFGLVAGARHRLREASREVAGAVARLSAARDGAERTAANGKSSKYSRVRDAAAALAEELAEATLEAALAEAEEIWQRTQRGEA